VALRDALLAVKIPFAEVHLTTCMPRSFRTTHISPTSPWHDHRLRAVGYELALRAAGQ